jgi:dTMP kinase
MPRDVGCFISIEGGEGVGKSTLIKRLKGWLEGQQIEVVSTREPGGTIIADEIRRLFKAPPGGEILSIQSEALLVSAARAQHVDGVIRPALKRGAWVLCDRFADSTRVYQGLMGGIALNELEWLIDFSTKGLSPDLTFLLDCDVSVTTKRIAEAGLGRDDAVRFDQASERFHEGLRSGFRRVAGFYPHRFYILDASESTEMVYEAARSEISRRFMN